MSEHELDLSYTQKEMQKSHIKPTKICQYGENCYRKNPIHFTEFAHKHLDSIYENGIDRKTNEYKIPEELFMSKDIIEIQLKLLEKLFPRVSVNNLSNLKQQRNSSPDHLKTKKNIFSARSSNSPLAKPKILLAPKAYMTLANCSLSHPVTVTEQTIRELSPRHRSPSPSRTYSKSPKKKHETKRNVSLKRPAPSTGSKPNISPSTSFTTEGNSVSVLAKKQKLGKNINDYIQVVLPKGQTAKKLEEAAPYNFFLTAITDSTITHNEPLTITFQEILDTSLGEIESSVQINFMVDVGWLLGHYYFAGCLEAPLLVLYGDETPELLTISQHKPQVTATKVRMSSPFATHHTKMMLFGYKDGSMRVVISTANLYEDDWHNRTQGIWISPKLNALPDSANTSDGESQTGFRQDLMLYLVEYKISHLQPWIARIRKTDFSSINVFLIASTPGGFRDSSQRGYPWGHARLSKILSKHSAKICEDIPIVAQSSSIGSLGPNEQSWIQNDIVNSFRKDTTPMGLRRLPQFKMIYPSFNNVKNSHDGMLGGGCLPYSKNTNDKQPWLKHHLYQWISNMRYRSKAMPHIKTYCRWSDEGLYWFVLTSANLSKAAWGSFNKNSKIEPTLRIMNYEVGVVFLPKLIIDKDTFPLNAIRDGIPPFPMPYDIPLKPYTNDDTPFLMDYLMDH